MIIFALETLADDSHRRHLVDPNARTDLCFEYAEIDSYGISLDGKGSWHWDHNGELWKPDWASYHAAAELDTPIMPTANIIKLMYGYDYYDNQEDVHIWTGRCKSTREKTEKWLEKHDIYYKCLMMRNDGDDIPLHELKEIWLDQNIGNPKAIDFVFESDPQSIAMWKRRGVFVFNCNQEQ